MQNANSILKAHKENPVIKEDDGDDDDGKDDDDDGEESDNEGPSAKI